jgi:hypothetical protein
VQVFVMSLVGPPVRRQISVVSGTKPRWTRGGKELIFETADLHLMAVDIDTDNGFHAGTPHTLFALPAQANLGIDTRSWTCDPTGQRFFLVVVSQARGSGIVEVATNFPALVTRR